MEIRFHFLKKPHVADPDVPVFSVVRNEMYFLPHFLRHYRALGVREFWFLDDSSTDGTREFLLTQPDCGVVQSNLGFGVPIGRRRFGVVVKTLFPRKMFQGRWVLTVDADEFLLLPQVFSSLNALIVAMEGEGLTVARALMLDFFPPTLQALGNASAESHPFLLCPFFDALEQVDWPDRAGKPRALSAGDCVRPRMLTRLRDLSATSVEVRDLLGSYLNPAKMHKVPLMLWQGDTRMYDAHEANVLPSDQLQLVLAHFKFYPGYKARITDALTTKAYWNNSIEYRFLDLCVRELSQWPLHGPRTRRFDSPKDMENAGLIFSRL